LSWVNVVEVQGDLDGRIHPNTAPHGDAWSLQPTCRSRQRTYSDNRKNDHHGGQQPIRASATRSRWASRRRRPPVGFVSVARVGPQSMASCRSGSCPEVVSVGGRPPRNT
jgi:hypothetical protein